jgi:ferredoxin
VCFFKYYRKDVLLCGTEMIFFSFIDPEEENRRLRDIMKCMVCRENDTNILFLPCTHHRMCEECAEKVQVCPVCDQKISEKIKTYLS